MNRQQATELTDTKVNVKVVLSGLWISMMFVFAYVDIFGYWRADVIEGALAGEVPGPGFEIGQRFLLLITIYTIIPSLMVAISLIALAQLNRTLNVVISLIYLASVALSMIGETWIYYLVGSAVEIILLCAIARVAWTWPRQAE